MAIRKSLKLMQKDKVDRASLVAAVLPYDDGPIVKPPIEIGAELPQDATFKGPYRILEHQGYINKFTLHFISNKIWTGSSSSPEKIPKVGLTGTIGYIVRLKVTVRG